MNKSELIEAIAKRADLPKTKASAALDAVVAEINNALKKGDQVALFGLGTFSVRKRAARNGRNPATGATVKIPASKVARFKSGSGLKALLNPKRK